MEVRFNATYRVPVFPVVGDKSNVLFEGSKEGRRRTRKRKKGGRSTWSLPLVQSGSAWLGEVSYLRRYLAAQREVLREPSRQEEKRKRTVPADQLTVSCRNSRLFAKIRSLAFSIPRPGPRPRPFTGGGRPHHSIFVDHGRSGSWYPIFQLRRHESPLLSRSILEPENIDTFENPEIFENPSRHFRVLAHLRYIPRKREIVEVSNVPREKTHIEHTAYVVPLSRFSLGPLVSLPPILESVY